MTDEEQIVSLLGKVQLFEGLSKKDLTHIARAAREVEHPAGHAVVTEDRPGVGFHLIIGGRAVVTQKGHKLRELGPGDSFGDIALIDGGPRSATVAAETPLQLLSLTSWEFKPLLLEHAEMTYQLLLQVCGRLRDAETRPPI
jgi:CRP-like cAMP-binding protein